MRGILLAGLLVLAPAAPGDKDAEGQAGKAAEAWLQLTDAGRYAESWDQAAPLFQKAVTKDQWKQSLAAARGPMGKLVSRKLQSATAASSLPGAPDGQYVVLVYATAFENKKAAQEKVTPMLAPDGTWRVSGYFIQ